MACTSAVAQDSPLAADQGSEHHHGARSERLHAFVHAWLKQDASTSAVGEGLAMAALTPDEAELMRWLRPAAPPQYHPRTGCMTKHPEPCYPSPKFMESLFDFHPGPFVVEWGPFLGEATLPLAKAITAVQATLGNLSGTRVLSVDSFKEHTGYAGLMMDPVKWEPTSGASSLSAKVPHPPAYYQFLLNLRSTEDAINRVVPVPLLASDAITRANAFGKGGQRPRLVYVNPPPFGMASSLRRDLPTLWKLLACGGTMAGAGYHLPYIQPEVDKFAATLSGIELEKFVVHAPGSIKYEVLNTPFSHQALIDNKKSNFSYFKIRNKPCTPGSD